MFDDWDVIDLKTATKGRGNLDHKVKFRDDGQSVRTTISADLIRECGTKQFELRFNGKAYAFVPNENGKVVYKDGHTNGITTADARIIMNRLNGEEFDAVAFGGAIVFPKENFLK